MEELKGRDVIEDIRRLVWERYRSQCANCGSDDRLRIRLVVPERAGGNTTLSNAVLLCRACEMAAAGVSSPKETRRPINLWVSRSLYESIQTIVTTLNGHRSQSSLVRSLLSRVVEEPAAFEDLAQYQDDGRDVRLNVWVGKDTYRLFKAWVAERGMTVTDAVTSLLLLYKVEAAPRLKSRQINK